MIEIDSTRVCETDLLDEKGAKRGICGKPACSFGTHHEIGGEDLITARVTNDGTEEGPEEPIAPDRTESFCHEHFIMWCGLMWAKNADALDPRFNFEVQSAMISTFLGVKVDIEAIMREQEGGAMQRNADQN